MKKMRIALAALVATAALAAPMAQAHQGMEMSVQNARVEGSMASISWVLGLRLGEGHLHVDGMNHKFRLSGVSILSAGLAGGNFKGRVLNLKNHADFEGNYQFAEAGLAYGVGGSVQRWQNEKGVVIEVSGFEVGVEARLGPGALNVSFVK